MILSMSSLPQLSPDPPHIFFFPRPHHFHRSALKPGWPGNKGAHEVTLSHCWPRVCQD